MDDNGVGGASSVHRTPLRWNTLIHLIGYRPKAYSVPITIGDIRPDGIDLTWVAFTCILYTDMHSCRIRTRWSIPNPAAHRQSV
jgi:hypothetical protein